MINIDKPSGLSAYRLEQPDKQAQGLQGIAINSSGRSFSALSLPLSDEEKERQRATVDNGVKTASVLNRKENSGPPSEQIAVTTGWEERDGFVEKIFNLTMDEVKDLKPEPLNTGTSFVSGLSISVVEAPESAPEDPIMYVASGTDHVPVPQLTWYKVHVNQVNPHSATREEMLALITHMYRDSEEALSKATCAFSDMDPEARLDGPDGRIDFMSALKDVFDLSEKAYKGGDLREKDFYEALLDMIDKLGNREDPQAKPSQKTPYHRLAQFRKNKKA